MPKELECVLDLTGSSFLERDAGKFALGGKVGPQGRKQNRHCPLSQSN